MKEKRKLNIHLYDTDFTVYAFEEDEPHYRKGARLVTDIMNSYTQKFAGKKTEKEIQYMALIDIAVRYQQAAATVDMTPVNDLLSKLTAEIETALKN